MNVVLVSEARHNLPFMPLIAAGGAAGLALAAARLRRPRPVLEPAGEAITVRRLYAGERAAYAERTPDETLAVERLAAEPPVAQGPLPCPAPEGVVRRPVP